MKSLVLKNTLNFVFIVNEIIKNIFCTYTFPQNPLRAHPLFDSLIFGRDVFIGQTGRDPITSRLSIYLQRVHISGQWVSARALGNGLSHLVQTGGF